MDIASDVSPEHKAIRKIRKKLRQIENLEILDRDLNEEELIKVSKKHELRKELKEILKNYDDHEERDLMKRQGPQQLTEEGNCKKARSASEDSEVNEASVKSDEAKVELYCARVKLDEATTSTSNSALVNEEATDNQKTKHKLKTKNASSSGRSESYSERKESCIERKERSEKRESCNEKSERREKSLWKDETFEVFTLKGHNDLILSVDSTNEYILSGSRDTTVRLWRVGKVVEERSLRGHTSAVTAVAFLPHPLALSVIAKCQNGGLMDVTESSVIAVSGGLDCTLRVWDVLSGESLGSIYTYNGITRLACGSWGVMTGTEGGRLEIWSLVEDRRTAYVDAFNSQVSAMHANQNEICAGSVEGEVGVWSVRNGGSEINTLYIMECESNTFVPLHGLAAIIQSQGKLYIGDSRPNIKVLAWRHNSVSRLVNNISEVGMTDSIALTSDGHILASSYFIDSGCPSINVRDGNGEYKCTLLDCDEGRYLALSVADGIIVTAGHTLKVWLYRQPSNRHRRRKDQESRTIQPTFLRKMSGPATESETEEDTDWASSSEDEEEDRRKLMEVAGREWTEVGNGDGQGRWWCTVL